MDDAGVVLPFAGDSIIVVADIAVGQPSDRLRRARQIQGVARKTRIGAVEGVGDAFVGARDAAQR